MEPSDLVCVKEVQGKGRGVFARKHIKEGSVIECVPVILVPIDQLVGGMHSPILARFGYMWNKKEMAISLGYGSLYNHSYEPNAQYRHGRKRITYVALRDIAQGEEVTINYNGDPKDKSPVGFNVV